MAANTQWTYRMETRPGDRHTSIHIETVPQVVAQRRPVSFVPAHQTQYPPTPYISYVPLPGHGGYAHAQMPDLFPIDLSRPGMTTTRTTLLCDPIPAFTIISVRDISNYVLCIVETGPSAMTTADLAEFLQHFVQSQLPSFTALSPAVQYSVKDNFIRRNGLDGRARWARFANGTPRFGAPTGLDLLLGNTMLWTLDPDIFGVWVATVDIPRQRYALR
ncbi:hypothetical protein B0H13DRAFT_2080926 [Mycena leptocephala]|nr:hypothetical protein B0H13DRAFT_2080926 [Mycena leptocephala]